MVQDFKKTKVEEFLSGLDGVKSLVVICNNGLTSEEANNMRGKAFEAGASVKVIKNNLAKIALAGTDFDSIREHLKGPVMMILSEDPLAAVKVAYQQSKDIERLSLVVGIVGNDLLDKTQLEQMAKLPSLDELRAKIVGLLSAPASNIARILQAPSSGFVRLLKAYSEKNNF